MRAEERWADVEGFDGRYQVSDRGRVRSFAYSKGGELPYIMTPIRSGAFNTIGLSYRSKGVYARKRVCELVAEAFVPNPDGLPGVRHIDGNPLNDSADNLEWSEESGKRAPGGKRRRRLARKGRRVAQVDPENGVVLAVYANAQVAGDIAKGISAGGVRACCNGERPRHGGYVWRYV